MATHSTALHRLYESVAGSLRGGGEDLAMGEFASRVRACDLTGYSDLGLRKSLDRCKGRVAEDMRDTSSVEVFAIVNEAISRRLGAWRVFGDNSGNGGVAGCQALASRLLSPYLDSRRRDLLDDPSYVDSETFSQELSVRLDDLGLDADARAVVKTMVYMGLKSRVAYPADILLSAEFYLSLSSLDVDGAVDFRATDEQLLAGRAMCGRNVVEMDAGEGKTIAAAFTAVWYALRGSSVHVVTANDYLASRDANWLAPVYESLGLTVGAVLGYMDDDERRNAYRQQIVYGTLREFGFDFLRDNLKHPPSAPVQGPLGAAIVDEVDHVLIDQALTPLIVAGDSHVNMRAFERVRDAVSGLVLRQSAAVRELIRRVDRGAGDRQSQDALLAELYLADPQHARLASRFAADPGARRRVRGLVDSAQTCDPDRRLDSGLLYTVDPEGRSVTLTDGGQRCLESALGPIFDCVEVDRHLAAVQSDDRLPLGERLRRRDRLIKRAYRGYGRLNQVQQMLRAYALLKRDVDYVVVDGDIVLIDELTGRTLPENRYQHGLHAALEAKEGVEVRPESEVLAQTSVPGMAARYSQVSGMTGTAVDSGDELRRQYGLRVVRIDPHRGSRRTDYGHRVYETRGDKLAAILDEVRRCRIVGRPVLVGTLTIEQSEEISRALTEARVPHNLLNAVNDAEEAKIVRDAGALGAVTIATNMAGRGTDILLGDDLDWHVAAGYLDHARSLLMERAARVELECGSREEAGSIEDEASGSLHGDIAVERTGATVCVSQRRGRDTGGVVRIEAGLGLYVLGSELNPSPRIDRQLWGRSGRQGAFGASRSILSLEDRMIAHGGGVPKAAARPSERDDSGRTFYEGPAMTAHLNTLQGRVAEDDEVSRHLAREYDLVLESQAAAYYEARREVVDTDRLAQVRSRIVEEWAARLVRRHFPDMGSCDYEGRFRTLAEELSLDFGVDVLDLEGAPLDSLAVELGDLLTAVLDRAVAELGIGTFSYLERLLFLQTSDELWREHLVNLQGLLRTVTVNAHGHRPAVADYAIESFTEFEMFKLRVLDAFLQRVATFPAAEASADGRGERVSLAEEASLVMTKTG